MFGQNMLIRWYELRTLHQHLIIIIDKEIITSATTPPKKEMGYRNKHTYIQTLPYVCTKEREKKRERERERESGLREPNQILVG
jgi:hypothetical protein